VPQLTQKRHGKGLPPGKIFKVLTALCGSSRWSDLIQKYFLHLEKIELMKAASLRAYCYVSAFIFYFFFSFLLFFYFFL